MGDSGSPEPERHSPGLVDAVRSLGPGAGVSAIGAVVVVASLLLPWYGISFSSLSQTGLAAFGFAHLALVLTAGVALLLIARSSRGHRLPRPLDEAVLLVVAGVWASVLVGYLMLDTPAELAGSTRIGLRMGVFVALGGSLAVALGGLRMRRERTLRDDV